MLNILIDAYAVAPNWGSEQGMGWNWVCNLARYCNLYVITEGEWQKDIETAVDSAMHDNMDKSVNPTGLTRQQAEHLHFYYLPVSAEVREMCWNQGTWKFYLHYERWERRAYQKALEIIDTLKGTDQKIDIVHKLNMICYREPSYLWKINDIPFVWGPVGGYGFYPLAYLRDEGISAKLKVMIKNFLIWLTFRVQPRVRLAMKRADAVISAYKENQEETRRVYRNDDVLINETGAHVNKESTPHKSDSNEFKLMWVGKYDHRKQLGIAIKTMARLKEAKPNIHLYVLGSGNAIDVERYSRMVRELQVEDTVHLLGVVPNYETRKMMQTADLFFFTSVDDATSTVVPEAIGAGLPIVCHALLGFGDLIDENVGRKISAVNPESSVEGFAKVISELEENRLEVRRLSENCIKKQYDISWEANAKKMVAIYESTITKFKNKTAN